MKKFSFSLDKVLDYKTQVEENLRNEHAIAVRAVFLKEQEIEQLERSYQQHVSEMEETKRGGCTVNDLRIFEGYLARVRQMIKEEKDNLQLLKTQEQEKREQVIEAKKERASIDMLKEKKKKEYDFAVQKEEEQFIEEFVSNTMAFKRDPA